MTRSGIFGTDGIRGRANVGLITAEFVLHLGSVLGHWVKGYKNPGHQCKVVIGKDTRLSGYLLEYALISGLISVGVDALLVGPIPTSAVSMLTRSLRADLGVMISASHNPYPDNGLKIMDSNGEKIGPTAEAEIEALLAGHEVMSKHLAHHSRLGKASRPRDAVGRYIEFAKATFPKAFSLEGQTIVVDAANGAAYDVAQQIFRELGATVISISDDPSGFNINQHCGSTSPSALVERVIRDGADLGIALDGDADRVVMCDETGRLLDGDDMLAVIATYLQETQKLSGNKVVVTHMSNVGLERYLNSKHIDVERVDVGDKNVFRQMTQTRASLGGEQSGHIILSEFGSTGDGIVGALQALAAYKHSGLTRFSQLFQAYTKVPQYKFDVESHYLCTTQQVLDALSRKLLPSERLIVRKSGTEPLIRLMIESEDELLAGEVRALVAGFQHRQSV